MPDKQDSPPPDTREMTRLESDQEIRQAIEARRAPKAERAADGSASLQPEVQPDRPVLRPRMALLTVLDDGRSDGEVFRLRADHIIIGRTEGDIRIPHDFQISGRHAEVVRQKAADSYRWRLIDLESTNGTFVRIGHTVLHSGNELLIGSGRYRFEGGATLDEAPDETGAQATTQAWTGNPVRSLVPSLVELAPSGPVQRHRLTLSEYWIGRDAGACAIARPDDVLVNPKHVRLFRDPRGQWLAENNHSLNGLWLRVEQITLSRGCHFLVGEQRFLFRPL